MDIEKYLNDILTEVNGQRAWDWVAKISQFSRVQASNSYHEIAEIIKKELSEMGYNEIEHFKSPADGKDNVWGSIAPFQWEIESGELWITEPEKIKLCDYNDIQTAIVTHSKSCDVVAEVIDIGKGDKKEDYESKDIKGKLILMCSPTYTNHSYIENSNALGVIYYPDLKRTGDQLDKRIYNSFFTTHDRLENAKFGFSISYRQAVLLKGLLEKGSVKLHAKINAKHFEGKLEVISTQIKGSEDLEQEIIIIAHLCHPFPSANDNASGAAGLLEIARILRKLIDKDKISQPKRTIRFVWVPEFIGTAPWMKFHENKIKNVLACINLDMIGEHRLKIGHPLEVNLAPYSTPSILNDIASVFIKKIADHSKGIAINGTKVKMSYRLTSFEGGSDHVLFADSYFGVPSLMFGHEDPYYHSSMDIVEYCDPTELKRVIGMGISISYFLSILDDQLINEFWPFIHQGVYNRLGNAIKLIEETMIKLERLKDPDNNEELIELFLLGTDLIKAFYDYEIDSLEWLENKCSPLKTGKSITSTKELITEIFNLHNLRWINYIKKYSRDKEIEKLESKLKICYQPNFDGPFDEDCLFKLSKNQLFKEFYESLNSEYLGPLSELINLISKGYDILRVTSSLSLEYKSILSPNKIMTLVNYLEEKNIIKKL
jgi:aminopeptidase-like protein